MSGSASRPGIRAVASDPPSHMGGCASSGAPRAVRRTPSGSGCAGTAARRWRRPPRPPRSARPSPSCSRTCKGSTDLGERLDAESLRELMARYFDAMRAELEAHGGTIEKYIGDAIMAVFGLPTVHEDDALRAVRAALEHARGAPAAERRAGADLGGAARQPDRRQHRRGRRRATRPAASAWSRATPVNTAARLEQAAPADGILLGELTYRLVRDAVEAAELEPLELKGKAERVRAWELAGLRAGEVGRAATDASRWSGGTQELERLRRTLQDTGARRRVRTVTILGDAGVGQVHVGGGVPAAAERRDRPAWSVPALRSGHHLLATGRDRARRRRRSTEDDAARARPGATRQAARRRGRGPAHGRASPACPTRPSRSRRASGPWAAAGHPGLARTARGGHR